MGRLAAVTAELRAAGCVAAGEEARALVSAAAGDPARLAAMVRRRCSGEPTSWIVGHVVFAGARVLVDPGVYTPRWQTEVLARRAASALPERGVAVDLCTGSGAVAVVLRRARPAARVVATDVDLRAVDCARRNGVEAYVGDLDAGVPEELEGRVDVVTAVAPYVPTPSLATLARDVRVAEPRRALDGGADGLAVVRRVVAAAASRWLRPPGWLLVELGADQIAPAARAAGDAGLEPVDELVDGDGDPCGLVVRLGR